MRNGDDEAARARRNTAAGFTLIELLVVVAIIGILAAAAVGQYQRSITKAKEASLRSSLYTMRTQINNYFSDKGKYPSLWPAPLPDYEAAWLAAEADRLATVRKVSAAHLARLHTPEACLPAAGWELQALPGLRRLGPLEPPLPFRVFRITGTLKRSGDVFYCRRGTGGIARPRKMSNRRGRSVCARCAMGAGRRG